MKTKKQIQEQLHEATSELKRLQKAVPLGTGAWRRQKGYVDALEWVLEKRSRDLFRLEHNKLTWAKDKKV